MFFIDFDYNWLFLFLGFLYFFAILIKYRNFNARHKYETETKTQMNNLRKLDRFIQKRTGLLNSRMEGANNTNVSGQSLEEQMLNKVVDVSKLSNFINSNDEDKKSGGSL